jgi:hypothetical protein
MLLRKRPDWSQRLPRTITIPEVMTLRTLADVRELLGHLPERCRYKSTWEYLADRLTEAASNGDTQSVAVPLKMVLLMEGVDYR